MARCCEIQGFHNIRVVRPSGSYLFQALSQKLPVTFYRKENIVTALWFSTARNGKVTDAVKLCESLCIG